MVGSWSGACPKRWEVDSSEHEIAQVLVVVTYREDEGNAAADCLGAVENGGLAQPEVLHAGGGLPAGDGGAMEHDLDAFAGGEDS